MAYRQRYGTCATLEFARKRHKLQARNGMDYSLKGFGIEGKMSGRRDHSTRQNFEKHYLDQISPAPTTSLILHSRSKSWEAKFIKNHSAGRTSMVFWPTAGCVCRRLVASTCKEIGPACDVVTTTR